MVNQEQTIEELSNLAKTNAEEALISIKKMIKKYPYFNALRVLELEVLKSSNAKGYKSALRSCALQTTQRNVLYQHLEHLAKGIEGGKEQVTMPSESNMHSFMEWLEVVDTKNENKTPSKFDWIDKFVSSNPKIGVVKKTGPKKDLSKEKPLSKNKIMTETLAHLYWKQKKYDEAKKAFKILSLKYPEKSSLFATHIKKIKSEEPK
jgi:predicted Zn-dependent protease